MSSHQLNSDRMTDSDWKMIIPYLDGTCTPAESQAIEARLQSDEAFRCWFEEEHQIWVTPERKLPQPDVESALRRVAGKCGIEKEIFPNTKSVNKYPTRSNEKKRWWPGKTNFLRIAAVLVLAVGASLIFRQTADAPSFETVQVAPGQRFRLTLGDGTIVTLDAGSDFRYPNSFSENSREVTLDGEALFEVTPDASRPFVVRTQDGRITVLGTTFNVRAWLENDKVAVTVIEGEVSLESIHLISPEAGVKIGPGQMSVLQGDNLSSPQAVNVDEQIGWLQRTIHFRNTALREVLGQLERWYDVSIELSDPNLGNERITVHLNDKPLDDLIDLICLICGLSSTQEGNRFILGPV